MPDNIPERNDTENTSVLNIEALDLKWYSRFEELASFETEDELTGDKEYREEQKKHFLQVKSITLFLICQSLISRKLLIKKKDF